MLSKKEIIDVVGLVLYRILLDFCYVKILNPIYPREYVDESTIYSYIVSWGVFLIFIPLIVPIYKKRNLSANIMLFLVCVSFIPTTSIIIFMPVANKFIILTFLYWLMLFGLYQYLPSVKLPKQTPSNINYLYSFCVVVLCAVVIYISGRYTNFRLHFHLLDVYGIRLEAREFGIPIWLTYLCSAAATLLPIMLVYYLSCKRYFLVIFLAFIIFLNFSIAGNKSVLFFSFCCFFGYLFYTYKRMRLFCWVMILICVVSICETYIFKSSIASRLFINRLLYTPAELNIYYYDFFSTHELDYFRQGILRRLGMESSYSTDISFLIGEVYFGRPEMRANNGLFADAYSNLGVLGVFVLPPILIFILKLLDACSRGLDEKLIIMPAITIGLSIVSVSLTTTLLTNGLLLTMLVLYLLPRSTTS